MKKFSEYKEEQATKRDEVTKAKPALETSFGSHSLPKPKPSMETSMGEHSKKSVSEDTEPVVDSHERTAAEHTHVHTKAAPSKTLDVHSKAAVESYTDSSTGLNGMLHHYHNGHNFSKSYLHHAHELTSVLDKHKTKEDTHVYTGVKHSPAKHFESTEGHAHLPAFTSTSTSMKTAKGFSEPAHSKRDKVHGVESGPTYGEGARHVLKIHVPKGTSAMSVKKHSFLPRENEVLLNRGHDIKIHPKPELHTDAKGSKTYVWNAHIEGHSPVKLPEHKSEE